jgi:hypothetical protein
VATTAGAPPPALRTWTSAAPASPRVGADRRDADEVLEVAARAGQDAAERGAQVVGGHASDSRTARQVAAPSVIKVRTATVAAALGAP